MFCGSIRAQTATTTTLMDISPAAPQFGQVVTLTATVTPSAATGSVSFMDGGALVGVGKLTTGGIAELKTLMLSAGNHLLRAVYGGSGTSLPSQSATQSYAVAAQPAACCLPAPKSYGSSSTFSNPSFLAMGDANGDGKADLVVLDSFGVRALLGNGDGTFQIGASYSARDHENDLPVSFAMGDFNGDGISDLVVGTTGATIVVLMGNGDGSFQVMREYPVGIQPPPFPGSGIGVVAVGDFNQDGKTDIVAADSRNATVCILLGNGNGSFQQEADYGVGSSPLSVAVADFNADGIPDLAVANSESDNISVLLGIGDGTFAPARNYAVGSAPTFLVSADFNGDSKADIAVANGANVTVLTGNGDGTFQPGVNSTVPWAPGFLSLADFDADGKQDLVLISHNLVMVALGNGDSTFQTLILYPNTLLNSRALAIGDFNGDGRSDIAVANYAYDTVTILIGEKPVDQNGLRFPLPSLPNGQVGVRYGPIQFAASGGTGIYTWSATGLPNGLSMSAGGLLSGTPAPGSEGTYNVTVTVTDSNHTSSSGQTGTFVISGRQPPAISSVNPMFVPGVDTNQTIAINGSGFQVGSGLTVHVTINGSAFDLAGSQVTVLSTTQLKITFNFGTEGIGTLQVINPDGQSSNIYPFLVFVPPTVTSFALPQLAFGGGWYTALYFSNPLNFPLSVTVNFIANDGTPLAVPFTDIGSVTSRTVNLNPGATAVLEPINTGDLVQGWAEASLPQGVVGDAIFRQSIRGRADQEAVVPLTPETNKTADLVYDDTALTTSVAFLNPSTQEVTVSITAHGADGSQIGTSRVTLAARSKQALPLRSLSGLSEVAGKRGWASFSVSDGSVSVMGFRSGTAAFTTIPVAHGTTAAATSALPQLAFGGGWYTALYFANPTGAPLSTTVNFIDNNGAPLSVPVAGIGSVSTQTFTVGPGATVILEAPNTGDLVQGWAEASVPQGMVGYAVLRQSIAGRADQEAVVPLTPESGKTATLVYDDTLLTTSLSLVNPSSQPALLDIFVYSSFATGNARLTLGARSKQALILNAIPGLSGVARSRGRVTLVVFTGELSVLGLRSGTQAFTTIPVNQQ